MKQRWSSLLLILAILLLTSAGVTPAAAQTTAPPISADARLITVTGEAEVNVAPDQVILTLGVETTNRQLRLAKNANDQIVKQVFAAAQGRGVAAKDIQTDYISIEPRYRDSYEQRDFVGFFVRKTVVITLRDVAQFEDLLSDVLDAGANHVQGIQFRTTELRKYRDQARSLAIQAAREKAVALAEELGQQVGQPARITEEQNNWWSGYGAWWGGSYAGAMTQNVTQNAGSAPVLTEGALAPGQISVTARVTVSFELASD